MLDELINAKDFAERVKYSGDTLSADPSFKTQNDEIDNYFSLNSMLVTPTVTPIIANSIEKVIHRLQIPKSSVKAYVYETARQMKLDKAGNRLDSDGVKLVASTMAKNVADRAMQVMGGYGYVGEYVVERLWRDAKLLEIGGGTLEAHQKNIARDLARNPDLFIRL